MRAKNRPATDNTGQSRSYTGPAGPLQLIAAEIYHVLPVRPGKLQGFGGFAQSRNFKDSESVRGFAPQAHTSTARRSPVHRLNGTAMRRRLGRPRRKARQSRRPGNPPRSPSPRGRGNAANARCRANKAPVPALSQITPSSRLVRANRPSPAPPISRRANHFT